MCWRIGTFGSVSGWGEMPVVSVGADMHRDLASGPKVVLGLIFFFFERLGYVQTDWKVFFCLIRRVPMSSQTIDL